MIRYGIQQRRRGIGVGRRRALRATSAPTTLLLDTFAGTGVFSGACDSGQTRTTVAGLFARTPGQLAWADDGSTTTPSTGKYGSVAANGTISGLGLKIGEGIEVSVFFNCDATLANGYRLSLVGNATDVGRLYKIVAGVETSVATDGGTFTGASNAALTSLIINGDSVSISYTDGVITESILYSAAGRQFKAQTVVGIGLNDGGGDPASITQFKMTDATS